MSSYVEGTVKIQSLEDLLAALGELGYTGEVHETPVFLKDYRGKTRPDKAHVVVDRHQTGGASNDIGFRHEEDGAYTSIVSQYDSKQVRGVWQGHLDEKHGCKGGFVNEVATRAAICAAERVAKVKGFKTTRTVKDRKVTLLMVKA